MRFFLRITLLCQLAIIGSGISAQSMYFHLNDGNIHMYPIDEINSIQFNAGNINLFMSDDAQVSYELSALSYYRYFSESVTLVPAIEHPNLNLYPNPVESRLKLDYYFPIQGAGFKMQIMDGRGSVMLEREMDANSKTIELDVHDLAPGNYYCTMASGGLLLSKLFIKHQ